MRIREGLLEEAMLQVTSWKNARIGKEEGSEQRRRICCRVAAGTVLETSHGSPRLAQRMQVRKTEVWGNRQEAREQVRKGQAKTWLYLQGNREPLKVLRREVTGYKLCFGKMSLGATGRQLGRGWTQRGQRGG